MPKRISGECFKIENFDGKQVLYSTDDVTVNKLTFTITNRTNEPLRLKGGEPDRHVRARLAATSEASTFSIDFETMLTDEVMANLHLTLPDGWSKAFIPGTDSLPAAWALAPDRDMTLPENGKLEFKIENIKCATSHPGNFEIVYRNIAGYADSFISQHLNVFAPRDPEKPDLPLEYSWGDVVHPISGQQAFAEEIGRGIVKNAATNLVDIYVTYDQRALIENGFTFTLINPTDQPLVDDTKPPEGKEPKLYISFVFGDESYAITTQSLADNNITINVDATPGWQPSAHIAGTAYWEFTPLSKKIMAAHENAYFPIRKIITSLNDTIGPVSTMYIQLNNIPGYNDTAYTISMQKKKAAAVMEKLDSDRAIINYGEDVRLSWISSLARRVTIEYQTEDKQPIFLDSEKGEIKLNGTDFLLPVRPTDPVTVITATAYDDSSQKSSKHLTITVNPPANIGRFYAENNLINVEGDVADIVVLHWEVEEENLRQLLLVTPEGKKDVTGEKSIYLRIDTSTTFILEAYAKGNSQQPVTASVNVFTWKKVLYLENYPVEIAKEQVMPAALANDRTGRLYAYYTNRDKYDYILDLDTRNKKTHFLEHCYGMALSKDGTKFFSFVLEPSTYTLAMYDTSTGPAVRKSGLPLNCNNVYAIVVSADLTMLYCTVSLGNDYYVYRIGVEAASNKTWLNGSIKVANNLGGFTGKMSLAFSGDGSKLYVANGQNGIAVICLKDFVHIKTLALPSGDPVAMVAVEAKNKLYVVCSTGGYITVVDTVNDLVIKNINTGGGTPSNAAVSPDGKYVAVPYLHANAVMFVDTTADDIPYCPHIDSGATGLSFSGDGKLLFVANYCKKSISIVECANFKVLTNVITFPGDGLPFAVAVINESMLYKVFITREYWPARAGDCSQNAGRCLDVVGFDIPKLMDPLK